MSDETVKCPNCGEQVSVNLFCRWNPYAFSKENIIRKCGCNPDKKERV